MRAALAALAAVLASACGARTPLPEDTIGDASAYDASDATGTHADASGDASACVPSRPDGGACNDLVAVGPPIAVTCERGQPPIPRGGAIADGTYVLVSSRMYGTCPAAESDRIVWDVCGSAWATIQEATIGLTTSRNISGVATATGTTLAFQTTCAPPGTLSATFDYDATPTSLRLYVHGYGPGTVRVDDFTRQ